MKKLNLRLLLITVNVFILYVSVAQVKLTATSGKMGPTSYTTLKAAFDAINLGMHRGSISIKLTDNTTEVASCMLNASGHLSASYASVLITPASGTNPVISGNFANPIIVLDGANNVHIDGSNVEGGNKKNLTISNENNTGVCIVFMNGASHNFINNAIFKSGIHNSGVIVLSGSNASSGNDFNTIENNDITGQPGISPAYGIFNIGTVGKPNTGNIYRNNRIFDFSKYGFADGGLSGINGHSHNTLLEGNEFYSTTSHNDHLSAILLFNATGITQMTISGNIIHNLSSTKNITGIDLIDAVSVTVTNNLISLSDSPSEITGITQQTGAGSVIKIYHNTIEISGSTSENNSFAFFKNWFSTDDEIHNNIFINTRINNSGTQGQYAFVKINSGSYKSDFNNLVSIGNDLNDVGADGQTGTPTRYSSLADWQLGTGHDSNSISVTPVFVSSSDLHIVPDSNMALDNLGKPIADVDTDVDGDIRSISTPDMGADEFTYSGGTAVRDLDESISSILLMPNMVNSNTTLRVHAQRSSMITWMMVDIDGKVVMTFAQQVSSGQNEVQLNLSYLMPGAYHIIGQTDKGRTGVIRFIKLM